MSPPTESDVTRLYNFALAVYTGETKTAPPDVFWDSVRAWVFVTLYKDKPESSHVTCCMSSGNHNASQHILPNIISAFAACSRDRRKTRGQPTLLELTLLQPRDLWRPETEATLSRQAHRAIWIEFHDGRAAIFLPSVWEERHDWGAHQLLHELRLKALGEDADVDLPAKIFSIGVFEIAPWIHEADHGLFDEHFPLTILQNAYNFYLSMQDPQTGLLAYKRRGEYNIFDNEGAWVRTYSDVAAFCQLSRQLNKGLGHAFDALDAATVTSGDLQSQVAWAEAVQCLHPNFIAAFPTVEEMMLGFNTLDEAFGKPQTIILLCQRKEAERFVRDYINSLTISKVTSLLQKYDIFACNWLAQAVAAAWSIVRARPEVVTRLVTGLREFFVAQRSSKSLHTMWASVAAHGFARLVECGAVRVTEDDRAFYGYWIGALATTQQADGGFIYGPGWSEKRLDVTSHVVCALLVSERARLWQ